MQLELAALQRVVQFGADFQPVVGGAVQFRIEEAELAAASLLGGIHGLVRRHQQRLQVVAVLRIERESQACPGNDFAPVQRHRRAERIKQFLRHDSGVLRPRQVVEHHHEFIAALPCDGVAAAQAVGQPARDFLEEFVAGVVT